MKFTFSGFVVIMLLVVTAFGCETGEKFLTKQDGLWNVVSLNTKTLHDSVLVSDITQTDSLGQMMFEISGSGYQTDFAGTKTNFTWSLNSKDDKLTIYFVVGQFIEATIKSRSKDEMVLNWTNSQGINSVLVTTENASKIKRVP